MKEENLIDDFLEEYSNNIYQKAKEGIKEIIRAFQNEVKKPLEDDDYEFLRKVFIMMSEKDGEIRVSDIDELWKEALEEYKNELK